MSYLKIMVTGITGQLGHDVMKELQRRGHEAIGSGRAEFSLTDKEAMRRFILAHGPEVIIHAAAYTAVDKAEDEPELARTINAEATRDLARLCLATNAKFIYISTDYVFPGEGDAFYETDSVIGPQNIYGATKLAGEEAVRELLTKFFIVRISWVFGQNGKNFIKTMLRLSEAHQEIRVVSDQIGSPTYTRDLAPLLVDMAESDKYGIYHATNEGVCSWADLAKRALELAGKTVKIIPILTSEYPTKAKRPLNSRLSKASLDKAGFGRLPPWEDALARYLREIGVIGDEGGGCSRIEYWLKSARENINKISL